VRILVLNPGSSTLKTAVLDLPALAPRFTSTNEWRPSDPDGPARALAATAAELAEAGVAIASIEGVGYRVVHGGDRFTTAVVIDDAVVSSIDELSDVAPLHNAVAAATIRAARRVLPDVRHVATFDTAFHATLPESGYRYPVPDDWYTNAGVRRFGFHGLSVAWSIERAAALLDRPVNDLGLIVAHLGGGCSVTAVDGGRSVDTSMGLTPLEGLMMGTRAGSIDPGIIFRLLRTGRTAAGIEDHLEYDSGLKGVGGTSDMARLIERTAQGDRAAGLAIDLFVRRAAAGIAAATTCLSRLDGLVFTGGIGEHATIVRDRICARLAILGISSPDTTTRESDEVDVVLASGPGPAILRVHAREDVVIARATEAALG
jgi:acetate kinase